MDLTRLSLDQPLDALGLDSLMAIEFKNALETKLGIKLSVASLLQGPTITKLASEALENLVAPESTNEIPLVIAQAASNESPLSYGQQALWFLHQLLPEEISFNVAGAIRILGDLDLPALEHAFEQLIKRHEALRSTFHVINGEPVQHVHESMEDFFHVEDVSTLNEEELKEKLVSEAHQPFDLENGPVLRASLFKRKENSEHILLLSMDHIVTDFWSMTILARELLLFYEADKNGQVLSLPILQAHYSDYVRWQNDMLASSQGEKLWEYWREELGGELPALNLPTDHPRTAFPNLPRQLASFIDGQWTLSTIKKYRTRTWRDLVHDSVGRFPDFVASLCESGTIPGWLGDGGTQSRRIDRAGWLLH